MQEILLNHQILTFSISFWFGVGRSLQCSAWSGSPKKRPTTVSPGWFDFFELLLLLLLLLWPSSSGCYCCCMPQYPLFLRVKSACHCAAVVESFSSIMVRELAKAGLLGNCFGGVSAWIQHASCRFVSMMVSMWPRGRFLLCQPCGSRATPVMFFWLRDWGLLWTHSILWWMLK